MLDIVEIPAPYFVGQMTHYGEVIVIAPPIYQDVHQSVIVKLNPASLATRPDESVFEKPPSSYNKIQFFPIHVDMFGHWNPNAPNGTYSILPGENLTIEDVSLLITKETFSVWKTDCVFSSDTIKALEGVKYAIVHRYSTKTEQDADLDQRSAEIINLAVACLALIRPTRRSRAGNITGFIKLNGMFVPQGFSAHTDPAEVPEVQKLFKVENQHISLLRSILPEFLQLYQKDEKTGQFKDEYEPIRMAVQLYEQAYAISYWKARHILWWAAIEAIYGNAEDAAMARIYALFGNKSLIDGYRCSIYEKGDVPSCFTVSQANNHMLGEILPLIYEVRNSSAHGQKVPDPHFTQVPHPFGNAVTMIDILAEAATFIIRKTIIEILLKGFREKFKDRESREEFWLLEYGLNGKQSKKRLRELKDIL